MESFNISMRKIIRIIHWLINSNELFHIFGSFFDFNFNEEIINETNKKRRM